MLDSRFQPVEKLNLCGQGARHCDSGHDGDGVAGSRLLLGEGVSHGLLRLKPGLRRRDVRNDDA